MTGLPPNRDGVLEWSVRAALVSYMSRTPGFEIATAGEATFTLEDGLRMAGRVDSAGVLRLQGSVILRAHEGALTLPLVGVEVTDHELTIDDPADEPAPGDDPTGRRPDRIPLVRLEPAPGGSDDTLLFGANLAPEADALFGFTYLPGTEFDRVRVSFAQA